jgi:hypothetical protein
MSIKNLLGLKDIDISDYEIIAKIKEAQCKNLSKVEFIKLDGSKIKIELPTVGFDPTRDFGS